ncbi:helix-hairpin-helix domain-containing protein [Flavobacterium crassostreae]|uniref:Competence protein ComEA n=1 Tax=Flavobacterium crassostreae TaxID=1763534 RepID=A0A1B9E802_9FLAO|nr:helix-hairpin-helix domain-containing protein [Flavobacterium crassostreae]OCB78075.1 hypothetical protein LPBF_03770 [Flavobacterium crassostreae]
MLFSKIRSYFNYSKEQTRAVLLLLGLIIGLQLLYFCVNVTATSPEDPQGQKWLSLQTEIDSLKQEAIPVKSKIAPFNPNFITDYKGYRLGMSVPEIDRLHAFRKKNNFVNSAKEFQAVTQVSDSLLQEMAVYFKFPDWVTRAQNTNQHRQYSKKSFTKTDVVKTDINKATPEDLIKVYGVGAVFADRILKRKKQLGCFVAMEQMEEIWGLSPQAIEGVNRYFKVMELPSIAKLNINTASLKEIAQFPYFKYALARKIIIYRSSNGDFKNIQDLTKIKDFPTEKTGIIDLYLSF